MSAQNGKKTVRYKTCPFCGDHLDFGERCRCQEDKPLQTKKETAPDGANIEDGGPKSKD